MMLVCAKFNIPSLFCMLNSIKFSE